MTGIKESFVIDESGKKTGVFLPIKDYNRLLEEIEDLEDVTILGNNYRYKKINNVNYTLQKALYL